MDGFALQANDVKSASREAPVVLDVVGSVAAGQLPDMKVTPGVAVRIMTGAPLPDGADAVVPFEDTDETERKVAGTPLSRIAIYEAVGTGANLRPAGQDVKSGDLVLEKGKLLRAAEIGVIASLGPRQGRSGTAPRSRGSRHWGRAAGPLGRLHCRQDL